MIENLFRIIPAAVLMFTGWKAIVNGIYPPTPEEDPEFYHESVEVNDKVVWSDMMRPRSAQLVSLISGTLFLIGGLVWFLYVLKLWPFQPANTPDF